MIMERREREGPLLAAGGEELNPPEGTAPPAGGPEGNATTCTLQKPPSEVGQGVLLNLLVPLSVIRNGLRIVGLNNKFLRMQ